MQVKLLQLTPDALNFIGKCASICYDSEDSYERNIKRAIACKEKGHLATLRFAHATFNVSGISRACSHQFVRSKHLDFLQRSQRYCEEDNPQVVIPDSMSLPLVADVCEYSYEVYKRLLSFGVKKEDARYILPQGFCTELNVVGNLQAWKDFIELRTSKAAQEEIRLVAIAINNILARELPGMFEEMK